jgi:hypothetical protein
MVAVGEEENSLHRVNCSIYDHTLSKHEEGLENSIIRSEEYLALLRIMQESIWLGEEILGDHIGC